MRATFSDYVSQWIIYDSYQEDYELQEKEREKEKGKKDKSLIPVKKDEFQRKPISDRNDITNTNIMKKSLILERMINQNMFDDILRGTVH